MGYAYPAIDTDGDGLIDGFEYVIGTRLDLVDSDGDGLSDSAEFSMVNTAMSDPCSIQCQDDVIFGNGFQ